MYDALKPGDFVLIQFGHNDGGDINIGKARGELHGSGDESKVFLMEKTGKYQVVYTLNCTPKVRHKTLGVFFMKYSYEQRLIIVSRVKQGEAIAHLSKEYHISETEILAWVRMWDHYGRSGLEQQSHCRPTVKLKEEVVRLILEKGVPLAHVRVEYRIGKTALQRWVSVVRKYGYGALEPSKRRGRPPKYPMGRPKKKEPQTELERLQAENLRLKAENALLKKAKALVEAKKAQALLNGHGPSTN